jgi:transcriptional regulator with XRE-family HTH domain
MDIFCTRLKAARELRDWTQLELSRRSAVPTSVISRLENGQRTGLTLEVARRLARALGMSLDALAGTWESSPEAAPSPAPVSASAGRRRGRPPGRRRSTAPGPVTEA